MSDNRCNCNVPRCEYHNPTLPSDPVGIFERGTDRLICVFPSKQACYSVVIANRPVSSWHNYYGKDLQ
jgi:hypothetical protein